MELAIEGVSKLYAGKVWGLRDFSLTLEPGILGPVGPNGAGKSTLMRILATVTKPREDHAKVEGVGSTVSALMGKRILLQYRHDPPLEGMAVHIADDNVQGRILHGPIEHLFHHTAQAVNLVVKSTSRLCRLVRMAKSPARSMAGVAVTLMLTPISLATTCASVVLPKPEGPQNNTWSSAS